MYGFARLQIIWDKPHVPGAAVSYLHVECLGLWGGLGRLVLLPPLLAEAQGTEHCTAESRCLHLCKLSSGVTPKLVPSAHFSCLHAPARIFLTWGWWQRPALACVGEDTFVARGVWSDIVAVTLSRAHAVGISVVCVKSSHTKFLAVVLGGGWQCGSWEWFFSSGCV